MGACLGVMLWATLFCLLSHDCVLFDVRPGSASVYITSGLPPPPICLKACSSVAPRSSLFPLYWNGCYFLAEGIHDQEPRHVIHRLLDLALWRLLLLPQVVEEEQARLELLEGSVGDPGVELSRALLEIVVLDSPLLDVGYLYGPIVQPSSLERRL